MILKLSAKNLKSEEISLLQEISGVNLSACYQCGNCSAGCPCIEAMDIPPQKAIRLCQLGQLDELLKTNTMWVCAACITCSVRCPKSIDIAALMEALRHLILRRRESSDYLQDHDHDQSRYEELPQIALINSFRKLTL
jgi:heterodisulfide reductase subunit C